VEFVLPSLARFLLLMLWSLFFVFFFSFFLLLFSLFSDTRKENDENFHGAFAHLRIYNDACLTGDEVFQDYVQWRRKQMKEEK
jgi:ABC-type sugar transport system permease subunit